MLVPFMRNSPHDAYLESGYSFALVSANIISDHFFDFYSYGTIQLWALMQDVTISLWTSNIEWPIRWNYCFTWNNVVMIHLPTLSTQKDINVHYSTEGHCNFEYTQLWSLSVCHKSHTNIRFVPCCSQRMSMNESPLKTVTVAPLVRHFGLQQHPDDNLQLTDNISSLPLAQTLDLGNAMTNFICYIVMVTLHHCTHFYGAAWFCLHSPFNMTCSSQPSSIAS